MSQLHAHVRSNVHQHAFSIATSTTTACYAFEPLRCLDTICSMRVSCAVPQQRASVNTVALVYRPGWAGARKVGPTSATWIERTYRRKIILASIAADYWHSKYPTASRAPNVRAHSTVVSKTAARHSEAHPVAECRPPTLVHERYCARCLQLRGCSRPSSLTRRATVSWCTRPVATG
jgi:hypothetical protein